MRRLNTEVLCRTAQKIRRCCNLRVLVLMARRHTQANENRTLDIPEGGWGLNQDGTYIVRGSDRRDGYKVLINERTI